MSQLFGKAIHAAFIVPDIDKAISRMLASGVGPFFMLRNIRAAARYRGARHDVLETAAFVYSGSMQYEFLEPRDDTPSAFREFLARHPEGGLHHLAYFCEGFDQALKRASALGKEFRIVQEFIMPDGTPYEIYVEPVDSPDPLLVQLMIPGPLESFFAEMEKAAATWDGKDPIRNALDLLPPEMRPPVEATQNTVST
jgi:catechol 2,3-dioxygenase-like lactoylglutathione lyase family enzyme